MRHFIVYTQFLVSYSIQLKKYRKYRYQLDSDVYYVELLYETFKALQIPEK